MNSNSRIEMLVRLQLIISADYTSLDDLVANWKDVIPPEFMYSVVNFMRQDEQLLIVATPEGTRGLLLTPKGLAIAETDEKLILRSKELGIF